MTIKKRDGKWAVVHCHGDKKGETIATHDTEAEALAQHRAIQASKMSRKKHKKRAGG